MKYTLILKREMVEGVQNIIGSSAETGNTDGEAFEIRDVQKADNEGNLKITIVDENNEHYDVMFQTSPIGAIKF